MGENISHLQEQIHELEQQLEGKSQKGLALNLEARIAEYQNRKIECERLEQKLEAQQSQLNAKNTEIAQKKEEQEVLQLRFSQAENELESYQHSIAELTQRKDELADLFALADICVSRAGANAICELLALRKPNLLIPLSANASRGDQILNAESFERQGFSMVLSEEELAPSLLLPAIQKLYDHRSDYIAAMDKSQQGDAISTIIQLIEDASL